MAQINENTTVSLKTVIAIIAFIFAAGIAYNQFNQMKDEIKETRAEMRELKAHYFNFVDKMYNIVYDKKNNENEKGKRN